MAKDRLAALKGFQAAEGNEESDGNGTLTIKMEGEGNSDDELEKFFTQVNTIRKLIEEISKSVEQVRKRHNEVLAEPSSDEKVKLQMDNLMASITSTAKRVRVKLEDMKQEVELNQCKNRSSAGARIRQSQYSTIWRQFIEVMNQYNSAQLEYRDACKARIRREMEIAGRNIENEELEELIESGDVKVFTRDILVETQAIKQTLEDIEARHNDILRLERSIRELRDMFMDMATLVQSQGEVIDRIEHHVHLAVDHIQNAKSSTEKAVLYHDKAGRKKIICISVLVVAIIIIILVIALPLSLTKK